MTTIYDTAERQPLRRRAIDSVDLLVRSAKWRARATCFALGFAGAIILCWISKGVA
jgi:hypothetical protein